MPSSSKSAICFFFETPVSLSERTALKVFVESIFKREKKKLSSLTYIFCTDKRVLEINKQYLAHDYFTDIISFELSAPDSPAEGEIYISIDRVRDNAKTMGEPFYREFHRVIFHGALHLCGYKDKTPAEEQLMRKKEDEYLSRYLGK
jgi:rRNA maturation RNase YbeY